MSCKEIIILQVELVRDGYKKLEYELEAHRSEGKVKQEDFLDQTAEKLHKEIVWQLQMNDERMNSYHQVKQYLR